MNRVPSIVFLISTLLAASIQPLRAQFFLPPGGLPVYSPVTITKEYSFLQTGANSVTDHRPTLTIRVDHTAPITTDTTVQVVSGDRTFNLQRSDRAAEPSVLFPAGAIIVSHRYEQEYPDNPALSGALSSSILFIKITTHGVTTTSQFVFPSDAPITSFRLLNFDALQTWDGSDTDIAWVPIPGLNSVTAPSLSIQRGSEDRIFSAQVPVKTTMVPTGGINGSPIIVTTVYDVPSSIRLSVPSSAPGEIHYGTLSRTAQVSDNAVLVQKISLRFPIKRPAPAPVIAAQPASLTAVAGTTATLSPTITASGATYVWQKDGTTLTGATNSTFTLTSVKAADAGAYTVTATNSGGSATSTPATLTVVAPTIAPTISAAPANLTVLAGAKSTLTVTPSGTAPFTYQWFRDGTALPGATTATLTLDATLPTDAAAYSVRITNSAGSVTSPAATLAVTPVSRISNLSVLTSLSSPTDNFTLGYVIGGANTTGPKPLLLRAAGPALAALGVAGTLDDPKLELFAGSTKTTENDNWGTTASVASNLSTAFTSVGAFPFASPTSKDAATTTHLTTRDNSVKISAAPTSTSTPTLPAGAAAVPGLVLAEIYDATPADTFTTATPRLLNVSVLKSLGTGLTVGFTIAGATAKTVLIRAIGPTLGDFGVPGTVADPQLSLFSATSSATALATNDNWSVPVPVASAPNATALTAAFTSVGAFALPATSKDAALLTTLPPGGYSVQVTGVNNTTGAALVEVYEVP